MRVGWITDPRFLEHAAPGHPERPARLESILETLDRTSLAGELVTPSFRAVDESDLEKVHRPAQIAAVKALAAEGGGHLDADTYVGSRSFEIACLAAGGVVGAVDAVLDGEADRVFAAVRPPGHHATDRRSMGFCLFNNIALGALRALERGVERALIIDWDVHHGNGTQDIFYGDPRVLYFSTHQKGIYPGTGHAEEIGGGDGAGATVNLPLPAGSGDRVLGRVFDEILVPVSRRFRPGIILVSAGYDAHARDPLASLMVTTPGFHALARRVVALADELCGGRVVACLEGGYDLEAVGDGVAVTLAAFLGRGLPPGLSPAAPAPMAPGAARSRSRATQPAGPPEPDVSAVLARARTLHGIDGSPP